MKISIERNSFLNSLSHVQNIVEKRNTIPILSNILIDAHSNNLILSATDMDVSVTEAINCNVIEQGSVTTPAHTLYDIVRKIPEGNEIEFNGTVVPVSWLNNLPSNVPILGELFSGSKDGEGLIGIKFRIYNEDGGKVIIETNPLSVLTPGFLQRIFD